jgi:hypothetical protein
MVMLLSRSGSEFLVPFFKVQVQGLLSVADMPQKIGTIKHLVPHNILPGDPQQKEKLNA